MKKVRVLVVDDSALARQILANGISRDPRIEVVGTAPDVYVARDKIVTLKPDVLTLDIEMPRMDGAEFLKRLMPQYPIPVIIVSALSKPGAAVTLDALEHGAVDFVAKPSSSFGGQLNGMMHELIDKIVSAAGTDVSQWRIADPVLPRRVARKHQLRGSSTALVVIGASTGGTVALTRIVSKLPASVPGVVIVQHMPPIFTAMFAEKLDSTSAVEVKEAEDGDRVLSGRVLVAPGGFHTTIRRSGGQFLVSVREGEPVNGHAPSIDVMMYSAAEAAGRHAVGVILTGMGADGAAGLKAMRENGARTATQDEASCVVYGMPNQACINGASEEVVPLVDMATYIARTAEGAVNAD